MLKLWNCGVVPLEEHTFIKLYESKRGKPTPTPLTETHLRAQAGTHHTNNPPTVLLNRPYVGRTYERDAHTDFHTRRRPRK